MAEFIKNDVSLIPPPGSQQAPIAVKEQERLSLVAEMEKVGITEEFIAKNLMHIMKNAEASTPKGEIIEDYATKLAAIKVWHKMKSSVPDVQVNIANIFPSDVGLTG